MGRPPDSGIVSCSGEVQRTHLWKLVTQKTMTLKAQRESIATYCPYSKTFRQETTQESLSQKYGPDFSVGVIFPPPPSHSFFPVGWFAAARPVMLSVHSAAWS